MKPPRLRKTQRRNLRLEILHLAPHLPRIRQKMRMNPRPTNPLHPARHRVPEQDPLQPALLAPIRELHRLKHAHNLKRREGVHRPRVRQLGAREEVVQALHVQGGHFHAECGAEDGDHCEGEAGVHGGGGGSVLGVEGVGFPVVEDHEAAVFEAADAVGAVGGQVCGAGLAVGEAGGGGGGGAELEDVVGDGGDHFGEWCFFGVGGRDGVFVILVFRVSRRPGFWMSGDDPEWQSAMSVCDSDIDTNYFLRTDSVGSYLLW